MEEEARNRVISEARREAGLPDPDSDILHGGTSGPVQSDEPIQLHGTRDLPPIVAQTLAKHKATKETPKEDDAGKLRLLSKKDARILLSVREMIVSHMQREEQARRSSVITVINPDQFRIAPNSIESLIAQALRGNDAGLHINDIIPRLEALGWRTTSVHHKYTEVYRAIRRHYYMFEKLGRAKFRLREAFAQRPAEPRSPRQSNPTSKKLTTIKDIAIGVVQKFGDAASSPSIVWAIMLRMGYDCSYSSVYKAMQDEKVFKRDGFFYSLGNANADKKSPEKSKRA